METKSLMGRIGKGSHGWTSRDYNIDVPCSRTTCPANYRNKFPASSVPAVCLMPSAIKINSHGVCQTGQDLIDEQNAKPKPSPQKLDGD